MKDKRKKANKDNAESESKNSRRLRQAAGTERWSERERWQSHFKVNPAKTGTAKPSYRKTRREDMEVKMTAPR